MKQDLLTVKELAAELRMSVKSIRRAYRKGEIPVEWLCRMACRTFSRSKKYSLHNFSYGIVFLRYARLIVVMCTSSAVANSFAVSNIRLSSPFKTH